MRIQLASQPTRRRTFLRTIAAGAAALGIPATVGAAALGVMPSDADAAMTDPEPPMSDAWLDKIRGKHRQIFDAVSANDGWAAVFAATLMDSYNWQNVKDSAVTPVVVFRHMGMPLTLNDAMWQKYRIGEFLKINDPKTSAPATRNIFRDNVVMHPGMTYESLIKRGAVVVACNVALTVLSGMTAQQAGVPADEAKKEWTANLLEGVNIAPSGVYAVNRAQERGCTYCYAG